MGIIEKKVLRSQNYHHSICGSFNSKNPEWGWNPPSVKRSPAIIFEWSKFLTFKFGEFFDIIIPYPFFFRQKLKHKLQWQSLMPILTWMIPTKNTKNARNKFWAKEWKIRCTSTTTWTNLKFLIPVLWSVDGFLKFQSLASRDYPTGDNNCGRFTDHLPTCSCPRSYWMLP